MGDYKQYLPYASKHQAEIVAAFEEAGSKTGAAEILGINPSNVTRGLQSLELKAAKAGFNPEHGITDRHIYATSTLVEGGEGDDFRLRWVKAKTPHEQKVEQVLNVLEGFQYKPAPKVKVSKKKTDSELATLYTITDFHLGMYAYSVETGDDWDTDIASKVMLAAIDEMMAGSPDSELGILNIQGDFLHWDGLDAVTPTSGHVLDADTRFDRMIELAIDLNVWAIERLLSKHKKVKVIICEGNHDLAGSAWLRKCIKKLMALNPRVDVDDTSFPYYAMTWGRIMLGFHHGHKMKNEKLPSLFSCEPRYREMWGQSKMCYIHSGHYHHEESKEDGGAKVERHPTLAGRDAHAARGGYVSERRAHAITYHKEEGEVSRKTVTPRY